jgi:transposase
MTIPWCTARWPHSASSSTSPSAGATAGAKAPVALGRRWAVERTNSWLSNYGQLRRNTDRCSEHRRAQLAFVIAILLIVKLMDRGLRAAA